MKEEARTFGWIAAAFLGAVLLAVMATYIITWSSLPLVNKQTQINRASNQYITTQQQELSDEMVAYQTAETRKQNAQSQDRALYESQEAAIIHRMKTAAAKIPGNVPSDVAAFLENK